MSDARQQVLLMLQDGKLTAEQAQELLQALEPTAEAPQEAIEGEIVEPMEPPDMDRFRRFWQYPFFIALAVLIAVGLGLRSLYQTSEGVMTFWLFCVSSLFALTFILTALAFMSRSAPWVHVRIKEKQGRKIAISLPLPMGLAQWGIGIARNFVPESEQGNLDMAAEFIRSARHDLQGPDTEPLMINVDDEDGDQVQVFIG
ncbi:MAG: hypothetical protein P8183_16780 [Anaerolineae bacterium]